MPISAAVQQASRITLVEQLVQYFRSERRFQANSVCTLLLQGARSVLVGVVG